MSQLLPTRGNLFALKQSRALAETGYQLMDKKRSILAQEMLLQLETARTLQERIDDRLQAACTALARAKRHHDLADLQETAPIDESIELRSRSVMGVLVPHITAGLQEPALPYPLTNSGPTLDEAYLRFFELKKLLIKAAEVETVAHRLAEAMKKTKKRTNALRHIVLPGMDADLRCIAAALEEKEREEYVRLKTIKP